MKTAQDVPRIGLARAKGDHLKAANESPPRPEPKEMKHWKNKAWKYVPSGETDISKTFARVKREMAKKPKK